jgi:ubiquinone/menaquinone biosynthesis C-methylase UbiE
LTEHPGSERLYHGGAERLRSPSRLALLEVPRVTALCLDGISAQSALDVGTGTGIFAEAFSSAGLSVAGADLNPELLAVARELVPSASFFEASAESLPCDDGAYDLVFLGHLLHEVEDPLAVLKEARRVARKRVAILEWPYAEGKQGPPLAHRMRPETVVELATLAGFPAAERIELRHMALFRITLH